MTEKIIHYVPGNWNGQAYVKAICGTTVSCEQDIITLYKLSCVQGRVAGTFKACNR